MNIYSAAMDSTNGLIPVVFSTREPIPADPGSTIETDAPYIVRTSQSGKVEFVNLDKFSDHREVVIPVSRLLSWTKASDGVVSIYMDLFSELQPDDAVNPQDDVRQSEH